jgi:hypothetical protein
MGKVTKAKKVYTPGSQPVRLVNSPGRGRPKKIKNRSLAGLSRKGNYGTKYRPQDLEQAITAVKDKIMTIREAAKHYEVPRTTIQDRLTEKSGDKLGRPTELTEVEESVIVERLLVMGRWGFPLNRHDLAHLIKSYLDRLGKSTRFVDNMPGPDFTKGFLKRHPQLTVRVANLIKRSRAALSHEDVNSFFDRFENSIGNIPPQNLWNYDETNMRDNPGAQKAIFQKGVKYAEQVRDHSKSSISLMYCYNGVGDSIPPFFVYKGHNVYPSWCTGGPKGSVYTSSPSGWFDSFLFGEWFEKAFLPVARRQPGKKMLLGDNLSSHLSVEVINTCKKENIEFVCLPANSTDKMQPLGRYRYQHSTGISTINIKNSFWAYSGRIMFLCTQVPCRTPGDVTVLRLLFIHFFTIAIFSDVRFFGPLKAAWKKQLKDYADRDPSAKLLAKTEFPRMIKEVLESLKPQEIIPKAGILKIVYILM